MFGMVLRGIVLAMVGSVLFGSSVLAAQGNLWHSDQDFPVTVSDSVSYPTQQSWMAGCTLTWSPVMQKDGTTLREKICVFHGNNLSMGRYVDSSNQAYYVIKIGADSVYRQIAGISGYSGRIYLRPDDDTLIVQFPGAQSPNYPRFWRYSLSDNAFTPEMTDVGFSVWRYSFNRDARSAFMGFEAPNGSIRYPTMDGYAFSQNRQFVLAWLKDDSVIVANTKTGETRSIAVSLVSGVIDSTISDDGKYAVLGTVGQLYYTENCGRPYDYDTFKLGHGQFRYSPATACERTYLYDQIDKAHTFGAQGAIFYFSDDNTTLSFDYPRETPKFHRVIQTEAYHPEQLDYLALGDSYSSGEGDIELMSDGTSYYTPVTDTDGGCHLSTRSYPFLLRDVWGINDDKMQSVACSGAKILPDYNSLLSSYLGQGDKLSGVSQERRTELQDRAMEVFIPGYVPQLEFVKKYQPKVITLTGGGNDVGFADILSYCATPEGSIRVPIIDEDIVYAAYTCDYAYEGSLLNDLLYDSIDTQAFFAEKLLEDIKNVSPQSKIIVVGYPSFVASGIGVVCSLNSATLDGLELIMLNNAVEYMNDMLERVASRAGALYVDIEDSLNGGRLCEGSDYMTGLFDMNVDKFRNHTLNEMFHPNAQGHAKIADMIDISGVFEEQVPATDTVAYDEAPGNTTLQVSFTDDDIVLSSGPNIDIDTATQTFADGSTITTLIFSKETHLGTYTADSDGSLHATVDISNVAPGRHVLRLQGLTPSGEQITLYQFVTIRATDDDADGDGILDDVDPCTFIESWYDEQTGGDICVVHDETGPDSDGATADSDSSIEAEPQPDLDATPEPEPEAEADTGVRDDAIDTTADNDDYTLPVIIPESLGSVTVSDHASTRLIDIATGVDVQLQQTIPGTADAPVVEVQESQTEDEAGIVLGDATASESRQTLSAAETHNGMLWPWGIMISTIVVGGAIIYVKVKI